MSENNRVKVKDKLLDIPMGYKAHREVHRLASNLNIETKEVKDILDELCKEGILMEKIEYICPSCSETEILNKELLEELMEEHGEADKFSCNECGDDVNIHRDLTGRIYYDVVNIEKLKDWK